MENICKKSYDLGKKDLCQELIEKFTAIKEEVPASEQPHKAIKKTYERLIGHLEEAKACF